MPRWLDELNGIVAEWSGILMRAAGAALVLATVGSRLLIRPLGRHAGMPKVELEVRNARMEHGGWRLGCAFCRTPAAAALIELQ